MNLIEKIVRADKCRKTRLHDEKGNRVTFPRLLGNGSRACLTGIGRVVFGLHPECPWISYDAIRCLRRHLTASSKVLEFGSGMSTIWLARHASQVQSVENYEPWHKRVSHLLEKHGIRNVNYKFAATKSEYVHPDFNGQNEYDLILVDGAFRSDCIRNSIPFLKPGGILYLDNSDKDSGPRGGDVRLAEEFALDHAKRTHSAVTYYTDFAPTQFTPNQGLMITPSAA